MTSRCDYAPIARSALRPALDEQGNYLRRVEGNLFWVADGVCTSRRSWPSATVRCYSTLPGIGNNLRRPA